MKAYQFSIASQVGAILFLVFKIVTLIFKDFLKSCYSTVADCLKSALFAESDSGDSGVNSGDSSMSSESSIERVTPDEVDENV